MMKVSFRDMLSCLAFLKVMVRIPSLCEVMLKHKETLRALMQCTKLEDIGMLSEAFHVIEDLLTCHMVVKLCNSLKSD